MEAAEPTTPVDPAFRAPQVLGIRCAIPTAHTWSEAMLFFNVDIDLSHNHNILGPSTQKPETP